MDEPKQPETITVNDRRVHEDDPPAAQPDAGAAEEASLDVDPAQASGMPTMPEVTFSTFVVSLASTALVHLGEVPDPESRQTTINLPMAKHIIDTLDMLRTKTGKCLEADEQLLMDHLLYELRMKYVMRAK